MSNELDPFAHDDAAYVLGALPEDERRAFEAHLVGCAACRGRVAEIQNIPALLVDVTMSDVADELPPDTLLPGLLRRAGMRRRRQRWLVGGLAAVAAACLVALAVLVWPSGSSSPTTTPQARDFVPVATTPVRANATLVSKAWGTQIDVHCSYTMGVRKPFPYALRVIATSGHPETLGTWKVPPDRDIAYQAGTHYDLDEIRTVQITLLNGTPILELDTR